MNNAILVAEATAEDKPKKRLIDQVRDVMRLKHYSLRTEQTYGIGFNALSGFTGCDTRGKWPRQKWRNF